MQLTCVGWPNSETLGLTCKFEFNQNQGITPCKLVSRSGQMKCLVRDWKPWVIRKFEHHYLKSSKRTNCLLIFYFISTSQVYFWSKLIKGPPQPLSCFCLHLGTRRTKLLEISTKRYLITKRNSKVHCRMVYELRKQPMAWMETDYSKHTHLDGR